MRNLRVTSVAAALLVILVAFPATAGADPPANPYFERTWERTDRPVADGAVSRTWMWGPEANSGRQTEAYAESPDGVRDVQYYDKSRMELTHPQGDSSSPWFVTNGLLVVELMTGRLQLGDNTFEQRSPSTGNVAGDADDPAGPTYTTFAGLRDLPARADGSAIVQRVNRDGTISDDPGLAAQGVTSAYRVQVPGIDHQVASPFWSFMNSSGLVWENGTAVAAALFLNPFYATGYPLTEAFWADVKVGGAQKDVLLQCFERRCLTYTPGNPAGWQVEAGNVGQHYRSWRYGSGTGARLYIADSENHRVDIFDLDGEFIGSWGTHGSAPGQFSYPSGIAIDGQNHVFVVDYENARVQRLDHDGAFQLTWGTQGSSAGQFLYPWAIAVDPVGNVYVVDLYRVQKFTADGVFLTQWGSYGSDPGQFNSPRDIAVDAQGRVYVSDSENHRIEVFDANGTFLTQWGEQGGDEGQFEYPNGIAIDPSGAICVVDSGNRRVERFTSEGVFLSEWSIPETLAGYWTGPRFLAYDAAGTAYVSDMGSSRVILFDPNGNLLTSWGGWGSEAGQMIRPAGIAIVD